jgi:hypothetical protein
LDALSHAAQAFSPRGRFTIYLLQAEGVGLQVDVSIGQAGDDDAASKIAAGLQDAILRQAISDSQNALSIYNNRRSCGTVWVEGVDTGIVKQHAVRNDPL